MSASNFVGGLHHQSHLSRGAADTSYADQVIQKKVYERIAYSKIDSTLRCESGIYERAKRACDEGKTSR
jgi:hypothetical protein